MLSFQNFPASLLVLSPRLTLSGDPSASIVGINTFPVADGAFCFCRATKQTFRFDRDSTAAPDGTTILQPLTGPGRWILFPSSGGGFDTNIVYDGIREPGIQLPFQTDINVARTAPPLPRDLAGTPLQCTMPTWNAGDVLEITWGSQAFIQSSLGASGFVIPLVDTGSGYQFVDNAMVFANANASLVGSASGQVALQISAFTAPPSVRLGLVAFSSNPGDTISLNGGQPLSISSILSTGGSTFLRCQRLPASVVNVGTLPPVTLRALPIPA